MDKWTMYLSNKVFYKSVGKGKPVVLIHGYAEDGTIWKYQEQYLVSHFQLIIPDIPGSGNSAMIQQKAYDHQAGAGSEIASSKEASIGLESYADCIKAILDTENIVSCIMVGHSMGGYVALAFAGKFPNYLTALGLFHSTAYPDAEDRRAFRQKAIEFIRKNGPGEYLKQAIPNLFAQGFRDLNPSRIEDLIRSAANFSPEALVQYQEAMLARPDRTHVLRSFHKPVLFVIGDEDKSVNLQESLRQCHIPEIAQVTILHGVAHMGMWEQENQSNIALMKFLTLINDT